MSQAHSAVVKVQSANFNLQTQIVPPTEPTGAATTKETVAGNIGVVVLEDPTNSGAFAGSAGQIIQLTVQNVAQPVGINAGDVFTLSLTPKA